MKKVVVVLVILLMMIGVPGECIAALAASEDVWEVRTTQNVLSETKKIEDDRDNIHEDELVGSTDMILRGSYTEKVLQCTHDIYVNGTRIFSVEEACTVWYYSDGKVHLYRRTLTGVSWSNAIGTITYGSIVNTDGSRSYTSGDRVSVTRNTTRKTFAVDFYVTGSNYNFSMYETN